MSLMLTLPGPALDLDPPISASCLQTIPNLLLLKYNTSIVGEAVTREKQPNRTPPPSPCHTQHKLILPHGFLEITNYFLALHKRVQLLYRKPALFMDLSHTVLIKHNQKRNSCMRIPQLS
jgi:hypothetical protein